VLPFHSRRAASGVAQQHLVCGIFMGEEPVSPANVWIAGVYVNNQLSLAHFNGSAWSAQTAPAGIYTLTGGSALSLGGVWFSGSFVESSGTAEPAIPTGG
jgi:hypothetical protein